MSNQIYTFIINNLDLLVPLFAALFALFRVIIDKKKQQVYANIFAVVSAAQALEGANQVKFKYALDATYGALPKFFKLFISEADISMAIEYSLNKLKAFANQQAQATSTKAITTDNLLNTGIKTGTDIAAEIVQNTAEKPIDGPVGNL